MPKGTSIIPHVFDLVQNTVLAAKRNALLEYRQRVQAVEQAIVQANLDPELQTLYQDPKYKPYLNYSQNWSLNHSWKDVEEELFERAGTRFSLYSRELPTSLGNYSTDAAGPNRDYSFMRCKSERLQRFFKWNGKNTFSGVWVQHASGGLDLNTGSHSSMAATPEQVETLRQLKLEYLDIYFGATDLAWDLYPQFRACKTVEKFIDKFPELEQFLPDIPVKVVQLPALPSNEVLMTLKSAGLNIHSV